MTVDYPIFRQALDHFARACDPRLPSAERERQHELAEDTFALHRQLVVASNPVHYERFASADFDRRLRLVTKEMRKRPNGLDLSETEAILDCPMHVFFSYARHFAVNADEAIFYVGGHSFISLPLQGSLEDRK